MKVFEVVTEHMDDDNEVHRETRYVSVWTMK